MTGTRAHLAIVDPQAARRWLEGVEKPLTARSIPGTLVALDHARGLLALADGSTGQARAALGAAAAGWKERGRVWEGTWALLDLARAHLRSNQRAEAVRIATAAAEAAIRLGAPALQGAASEILTSARRGVSPEPWDPLSAREFEVARLIAEGRTNGEIALDLGVARKTIASHVEHILAKLDVGRRAEIAAWTASRPVLHSRPHGEDREE